MRKNPLIKKSWAIGTILLFLGTSIIPVTAQDTEKSLSPLRGKWLYVGGSGPGNYSTIQGAINDAVHGDTIFVYAASSPYYENLIIEKSIILIGEKRETTCILGDENSGGIIINISADDVSIRGFTIQPVGGHRIGIAVYKNYTFPDLWNMESIQNVTISDTIIKNTSRGIFTIRLNNGKITGNIIEYCTGDAAVYLLASSNNTISYNFVAYNGGDGIIIDGMWGIYKVINNLQQPWPKNNTLLYNTVKLNRLGIEVNSGPINTRIYENNITDNLELGVLIIYAYNTEITENNFINNGEDAFFSSIRFPQFVILKNSWENNYWGHPTKAPIIIHGSFISPLFLFVEVPLMTFDWRPAQEPFDIPEMR
jgi:hypothetical protein